MPALDLKDLVVRILIHACSPNLELLRHPFPDQQVIGTAHIFHNRAIQFIPRDPDRILTDNPAE